MRHDIVIVDAGAVEMFRKAEALSKVALYGRLGINGWTGQKVLNGQPVSLAIAKKVAAAMGVEIQQLIESWKD